MDVLATRCKDKLAYFRIKELKDVLSQLGLSKQGKKQDLVIRIMGSLSDEQASKPNSWGKSNIIGKETVARIIDDTYRKMQVPGAVELASKSRSGSDTNIVKTKEEYHDSLQLDMKVRCLCGSTLVTESMIKCEDPRCQVWQHIGCVIIPEKPMEGVLPELPPCFYCELCRLNRADPFWVTMGHPLLPAKLPSCATADGTTTVQTVDKTFQLTRADRDLLQRADYDLQVWSILLNDKVSFRMQWPQYAELQVNGIPVRATNRPGTQLLGINGRDDGPVITTCSKEGINKIVLSRSDNRIFCFGIRIGRRRTVQQVLSLIPKEVDGEPFEDALARIRRCIGGGAATENADSDSDLEVVAESVTVTVNLRCPMSGSRIRTAGRFKPCAHMGCFDLEAFVELNQRSRKWQCPICLKNYSLESVIIDPYFNRITSLMLHCGEDVTEIDVNPDGSWRGKNTGEFSDLAQLHLPDGRLCATSDADVKPDLETLKQIKQEGTPEGPTGLKLGIKRNRNGTWEVSKPDVMRPPSFGNQVLDRYDNHGQNIVAMSSSATGSYKDGEDPSVNGEGHFDFGMNNGHELDSLSLDFDPTYNGEDRVPPGPLKDADIIVLSDSEDDNVYDMGADGNGAPLSNLPTVSERFPEDPGLGTSGNECLGLFNNNCDEFGLPLWPLQGCPPTGPEFQLFGANPSNPDALVDVHNSLGGVPIGGYSLASDKGLEDRSQIEDVCQVNMETNDTLVDNPLAFGNDDPALQIFLPSRSEGAALQDNIENHSELPNGDRSDDWISLTLAGSHGAPHPTSESTSRQKAPSRGSRMESLADTASLLLSMNDGSKNKRGTSNGGSSQKSDGPFSHPRQPRSVRPRLYLSIDTDSDSH